MCCVNDRPYITCRSVCCAHDCYVQRPQYCVRTAHVASPIKLEMLPYHWTCLIEFDEGEIVEIGRAHSTRYVTN